MSDLDFLRYYDLEGYLFSVVGPRFHEEGSLSAFDFMSIVIWKANRAKSMMARRLLKRGHDDLDSACESVTAELHALSDERERFLMLARDWGFRLPIASAVLTVLYPDEFTVYDVRACDVVGGFHAVGSRTKPENVWRGYVEFRDAVIKIAPEHLSLRDKDRYLWARSAAEQLEQDIENRFGLAGTVGG